jgi:hypothetical protein
MDATPGYCRHTLQWRWTLPTATVSLSLLHPHRSKAALAALMEDWQGLFVSEGYGV